ncbi:MAG: Phosphotransferase system, phosphocarrier protein HPr [Herbinix sp.]|nr:Phosphotransferase system, phosphocarrier protein HPr [Herbinix sp.]
MKEIKYVIKDELGIHARPAGLLVKEARRFQSEIILKKDNTSVDAKSILRIMGLGAKKGDEITMTFHGADEAEASTSIKAFLAANL